MILLKLSRKREESDYDKDIYKPTIEYSMDPADDMKTGANN
jgi:hypothetical protein